MMLRQFSPEFAAPIDRKSDGDLLYHLKGILREDGYSLIKSLLGLLDLLQR